MLVPITRTEGFNKALEIQQSKLEVLEDLQTCIPILFRLFFIIRLDLLSSYEISAQVSAIEDLIAQGESMQMVLRLLCLASIVNGGIKAKTLENIKREVLQVRILLNKADSLLISFIQSYGYENLPLLLSLSSPPLGLLVSNPLPNSAPSLASLKLPYSSLRKSLKLVAEDIEEADVPEDISYVYSGYAPVSVRLVQCVVQKGSLINTGGASGDIDKGKGAASGLGKVRAHPIVGWKGFEDVVGSLPGEMFDVTQTVSGAHTSESAATTAAHTSELSSHSLLAFAHSACNLVLPLEKTTTSVVFFLGGCTYTEIAALRWIGRQTKGTFSHVSETCIEWLTS